MRSTLGLVIVGGGRHGPPTAHDLAAIHGITDVAVIEAARIGGGNTARNTLIVRSDDLLNSGFRPRNGCDTGMARIFGDRG